MRSARFMSISAYGAAVASCVKKPQRIYIVAILYVYIRIGKKDVA